MVANVGATKSLPAALTPLQSVHQQRSRGKHTTSQETAPQTLLYTEWWPTISPFRHRQFLLPSEKGRCLRASACDPVTMDDLLLLNGFELRQGGMAVELPTPSQRVLAFLAIHDRHLSRSFVSGSLWPDTTEAKAAGNLRTSLWRLRKSAPGVVEASATNLRLRSKVRVDVHDMCAVARRLVRRDKALDLTRIEPEMLAAELLPGWWDCWVVFERERLRQTSLHGLEALSELLLNDGQWASAAITAAAAVKAEPLRESAHRLLIRAHLAEGNRSEANRQYQQYRTLLLEELGVEPSPDLETMMGRALSTRQP